MDMAAKAAPLVAHVAGFVRIVNASHTQELHQWTVESLDRAFAWAHAMESLVEKAAVEGDDVLRALDAALLQHLPHAALPTTPRGEHLCVSQLRCATRLVCDGVLTSAWIDSHPARSQFVSHVLKKRLLLPSSTGGSEPPDDGSLSELFMRQIHSRRSLGTTMKMAGSVHHGLKRRRVQVCSAVFEIPSLVSYTTHPRTQHLRALARTLQGNLCAAKSLASADDAATYQDLLARVESQLKQAQPDVVEVIVWSVVLDAPLPPDVRADVVRIMDRWSEALPMQTLLSLAPWPAAMLAHASSVFARHYVPGLLRSRVHTLDKEALRCRVGALALQGGDLQTLVETQLTMLDPFMREELLSDLTI